MALREIAAHFGFSVDKSKLDDADKSVGRVKEHAESSAQGVGVLVEAFQALAALELVRMTKDWVEGLVEQETAIAHTSEATGLSIEQLQVWQLGASEAGVDADEFSMSLRRLSSALAGGADEAGSQSKVFAKLKIATHDAHGAVRPLADILPEISEHFKGMSDGAGKSALATELFGRQGSRLIPLLNKGSAGIAEMTKEFEKLGGGFSEESIQRAEEVHVAMVKVTTVFNSFKNQLALAILPRVQTFLGYLENGVSYLTDLAKETTLADSAVGSLATTLAITLAGALSPFIGGALKFAAIYLAVDDLKGFLEGQDSEIGAILDGWFGDGTADVVREWCLDASSQFGSFFDDLRATLPIFELDFTIFVDRLIARWTGGILSMQQAWNGLVDSAGLNDRFKINTDARVADFQAQKERIGGLNYLRNEAAGKLGQYAKDTTPTSGAGATNTQQVTAPFRTDAVMAPPQQSWNTVQNAPQITINLPAGAPAAQAEAVGRATRQALRDSHRAAIQTLENRGGAK